MKSCTTVESAIAPAPALEVRVVSEAQEVGWFDEQLATHHPLTAGRPVGDYLRQLVSVDGVPVALLAWGPACYALKDRDRWISWSANQRVERLKLIVQNRRFLLLRPKGQAPNLASQSLSAASRALPEQWRVQFGYRPLLAETFTDPEAYAGTCYRASNWEAVGWSAGYQRHRADFYLPNERPKRLWLRELAPDARRQLRAMELPADCRLGLQASPSGVLPLNQPQMQSLYEVLRSAPDPRDSNTVYRTPAVMTILAMALLAGRREIAEIARFATTLSQAQRHRLNLPLKKGTKAFRKVPSYSVFYEVLRRMDPELFAAHLHAWLGAQAGSLPQALALDGKMIRDAIGILTLADHEDGAPRALAVYDQKEGTERCEQSAAAQLREKLPALDDQLITADPLHCQRALARAIVEKGGDYLLQVKGNQPHLLRQAQGLNALSHTPFLSKPKSATDASKSAPSMPSPSNHSPSTSPSPDR